jgi:hypothetical protein
MDFGDKVHIRCGADTFCPKEVKLGRQFSSNADNSRPIMTGGEHERFGNGDMGDGVSVGAGADAWRLSGLARVEASINRLATRRPQRSN